jgi:hypothetical protein
MQMQQLVQGMRWLKQKLTTLGGAPQLLGIDVGRMALDGKVLLGIRIYARPEGQGWLRQYGFPGLIETPYGTFYAAVLGQNQLPQQVQQQRPGQPMYPGAPRTPGQGKEDPYAGWDVKISGTDLENAQVKHYGSDIENMPVKVYGTKGVVPKGGEGGEFRIKSGCFGTTFSQFEPEK